MKLPKVLIFTPIYEGKDYCLDRWLGFVKDINYPNKKHIIIDNSATSAYAESLKPRVEHLGIEVYHVGRGNNSREALTRAQVFARKMALDEGYDYLLSIESDIMVPPNVVQWLVSRHKGVVTGCYLIGTENNRIPCITLPEQYGDHWGTRLLKPEEFKQFTNNGIVQVQAGGMGCCLMRRDVLEKVGFYYDSRFKGHSDIYFFNSCFNMKIPVFVDTDMWLDHDNKPWDTVADR